MKKTAVIIMIIVLLFSFALPVVAAYNNSFVEVFETREIVKRNKTLPYGRKYQIPERGIFRVEKGAVLTVEGNLEIAGTLKNYGTIIIIQGKQYSEDPVEPGRLTVTGSLQNYGKIKVESAYMENRPTGKINNEGTIILNNSQVNHVVLRNSYYKSGNVSRGGEIVNAPSGKIYILADEGIGISNQKGATIQNDGLIAKTKKSKIQGDIKGKPVSLYQPKTS